MLDTALEARPKTPSAAFSDPDRPAHFSAGTLAKLLASVALLETLHPPACINQLLLTSVERVALGAYLYVDLGHGRMRLEAFATRTSYCAFHIIRVYIGLQLTYLRALLF